MKASFGAEAKTEPADRGSPGPLKATGTRKAVASANIKPEPAANGYGSPQNALGGDEPEPAAGATARGAGKRKAARATAGAAKEQRERRAGRAGAHVPATPASSTGGSSSEAEASESENDAGRAKKGAAAAAKEKTGRGAAAAGRQRNSDSSSSSKEGAAVRKGRAAAPGANAKAPVNPFNKPPVAVLKKSGESFLQVSRERASRDVPFLTVAPSCARAGRPVLGGGAPAGQVPRVPAHAAPEAQERAAEQRQHLLSLLRVPTAALHENRPARHRRLLRSA